MGAYFKGSYAHRRLRQICRKLGAHPAEDFYGFTLRGRNFLYRRAYVWLAKSPSGRSWRWHWKKPFGSESDRRSVDYIVLHGPRAGPFEETFFVFPESTASRLAQVWPSNLDLPADQDSQMRGGRDKIWERKASIREIARVLK